MNYQLISIGMVRPSPTNPRQNYDEKQLVGLADSIKQVGLLSAIIVRAIMEGEVPIAYEIIAGERRYRAHKLLDLQHIKAEVVEMNDEQVEVVQNIENLQRADLSPLEESDSFIRLIQIRKQSIDEISAQVGKSKTYIYQRMQLATLIDDAKLLLYNRLLPLTHAVKLSALEPKIQKKALKVVVKYIKGEDNPPVIASLSELENYLTTHIFLSLSKAPFDINDPLLSEEAGACITCPKRTRAKEMLFNDMTYEGDNCLDAKCFWKKKNLYIEKCASVIENEIGKRPVLIATQTEPKMPEEVQMWYSVNIKEDGGICPKCQIGMFFNGPNTGKTLSVCCNEKGCQHPGSIEQAEMIETTDEQRADKQERMQRKVKTYLIQELPNQHILPLTIYRLIILKLWDNSNLIIQQMIASSMNWQTQETYNKSEAQEPEMTSIVSMENNYRFGYINIMVANIEDLNYIAQIIGAGMLVEKPLLAYEDDLLPEIAREYNVNDSGVEKEVTRLIKAYSEYKEGVREKAMKAFTTPNQIMAVFSRDEIAAELSDNKISHENTFFLASQFLLKYKNK